MLPKRVGESTEQLVSSIDNDKHFAIYWSTVQTVMIPCLILLICEFETYTVYCSDVKSIYYMGTWWTDSWYNPLSYILHMYILSEMMVLRLHVYGDIFISFPLYFSTSSLFHSFFSLCFIRPSVFFRGGYLAHKKTFASKSFFPPYNFHSLANWRGSRFPRSDSERQIFTNQRA